MFFRQKLLKHKYTDNFTDIVFFFVGKIYFLFFFFIKALDLKGIINTVKKGITSAMECADVAAFTFPR